MAGKDIDYSERFDPKIAEAMIEASKKIGGLPAYLGMELEEFSPGRLTAKMEVRQELVTTMGAVHGGVMAAFVDHCLGCVLYPLMERGQWAATTEFKLNYLAAVKEGTLDAESTVLSLGGRSAVVRCEVRNAGRLVCTAQGTLLVSAPPGSSKS
ncbi:MAG: PaaI family thioesterase [Deltaproteobacteria bacterium]